MSDEDVSRPGQRVRPSQAGYHDDWSRVEERELRRFASQRKAVEHWRAIILEFRAKLQAVREKNQRLMTLRRRLTLENKERDRRPPGFPLRPQTNPDNGRAG